MSLYFCLSISTLAIVWIVIAQGQESTTPAIPGETTVVIGATTEEEGTTAGVGNPTKGEGSTTPGVGTTGGSPIARAGPQDKSQSGSKGEVMWNKWDSIGGSDYSTSWLKKYCPRSVTPSFEKVCIVHCWWNGWQGGRCTKDDVCICLWKGLGSGLEPVGKPIIPNVPPGPSNRTQSRTANSNNGEPEAGTTLGTGGSTPETGGSTPETGGSTPETGGSTPETGASTQEPGGATPVPGGATAESGGTTSEPGGATPEPGGATPEPGETTPETAASSK